MKVLSVLFALLLLLPVSVSAQDKVPPVPAADMEKRMELSRRMHQIQPAAMQVEKAIGQVATQLSPKDRDSFKAAMMNAIDGNKLEALSISVMAEMFTAVELEHMLSYFDTAEARSISEKMPLYNGRMQPEIMKMLDAAMMAARTGASPAQR